nr:hypothetical protein [Tanacetum cinerariifolium]
MARMDAMIIKMDAQYKELQYHAKQPTPDLDDDDIPMSREEEAKNFQSKKEGFSFIKQAPLSSLSQMATEGKGAVLKQKNDDIEEMIRIQGKKESNLSLYSPSSSAAASLESRSNEHEDASAVETACTLSEGFLLLLSLFVVLLDV